MSELKITLQSRITGLMITSSIIFIAIFTFIQVNNQMAQISRYNTYRSNLSAMITKTNLESIIRLRPLSLSDEAGIAIKGLIDADMAKDITLFDTDGKVVYSSEGTLPGEIVPHKDSGRIEALIRLSGQNRWILPEIDAAAHKIFIYIGITSDDAGPLTHVAKISIPSENISEALSQVYRPVFFATLLVILANIIFGYLLSKTVIGPIKLLNNVTKIISEGDLTVRARINTGDEFSELGKTFNYMTEELVKIKERAENANPLTKLPGNIIIQEIIDSRIKANDKFTVIFCDLDNFKAFNDKYGIGKGDEAIKLTSGVLRESLREQGASGDFVGHEGGDDFVLVTTPDRSEQIANFITSEFDKRIRSLYDAEDLARGYIIAHSRDGVLKQFSVMTISLSGVTNLHRDLTSYGEVTNIAAEVKKRAKAIGASTFVIDSRKPRA